MPPEKHALLSASSASRWIACPPSVRLTEGMPDAPSPYAEEGTKAHARCETFLRAWIDSVRLGVETYIAGGDDAEMDRCARAYLDFVESCWDWYVHEPGIFVEQRVDFSKWVPDGFGTCDCLLIGDGVLHIIDFKYGAGVPVSPVDNAQMMCYALGAVEMFIDTDEIETVKMSIVQPRIQDEPETWEIPICALLDWAEYTLKPAAELAIAGKGEFTPGEKQCRFCKAYPSCRAWKDKYGELADFPVLPEAGTLSEEELGEWLGKLQGIAAYAKDLEAYVQRRLIDGATVPGWKLVEGRSTRKWTDQRAAFEAMVADGIDRALLYEQTPITLTAAEKLLGKKAFAAYAQYVEKPAGAPKLAPASDKRPEFDPADGFAEV